MAPCSPHPFPAHLFDLVLHYLLPPTPPIPSHLLSNALLQRHYYLKLDCSSDPADYFLWPGSKQPNEIILKLQEIAGSGEELRADQVEYEAHDDDALIARVTLTQGLQVVFVLDRSRPPSTHLHPDADYPLQSAEPRLSWRYHNVVWRDDHSSGYPTIEAALAALHSSAIGSSSDDKSKSTGLSADEFWDGWGSSPNETPAQDAKSLPAQDEDSYFARYLNVVPSVRSSSDPSSSKRNSVTGSLRLFPPTLDLPQIPTEGFNTPDLPPTKSIFDLNHSTDDLGMTPVANTTRATLPPGNSRLGHRTPRADDAFMEIIRGTYRAWSASQGLTGDQNSALRKGAFISLVEEAISS
ncbi:hypothetical protein FRB99_002020 [Tulasnella sp. 403]|nr:hypothetical protein FRB99_002020 [Tulasnella sp. 403]